MNAALDWLVQSFVVPVVIWDAAEIQPPPTTGWRSFVIWNRVRNVRCGCGPKCAKNGSSPPRPAGRS